MTPCIWDYSSCLEYYNIMGKEEKMINGKSIYITYNPVTLTMQYLYTFGLDFDSWKIRREGGKSKEMCSTTTYTYLNPRHASSWCELHFLQWRQDNVRIRNRGYSSGHTHTQHFFLFNSRHYSVFFYKSCHPLVDIEYSRNILSSCFT